MHGAYILTYPHLLFKTVENSFSPGILHHGQRGSAVLMAGSMDELHKEAQRNNQQANGDDNEGGYDHRSARLVDARCIRLVGHWLDLLQIAQIMEEITHHWYRLVWSRRMARITTVASAGESCGFVRRIEGGS